MVRKEGVEPSIPKALVSETSVYASSTTLAWFGTLYTDSVYFVNL